MHHPSRMAASRLSGQLVLGAVALAALVLGACGSGGATPTPTAKGGSPSATARPAAGGAIRPLDGGGAAPSTPATPSTPEPVPAAVTSAFPGLPLDKVQAMNYNPDSKRLVLVTYLGAGDAAAGQAVCKAFLGVAMFDPSASISVVATDYSQLATCAKE